MINVDSIKKTKDEIMRDNGKVLRKILGEMKGYVRPGISTSRLDEILKKKLDEHNATSSAYQYGDKKNPFPAYACWSVNEVICHGVPTDTPLNDDDVISIDVCFHRNGYHVDSCVSMVVGNASEESKKLVANAKMILFDTLDIVRAGVSIYDIGKRIEESARSRGCVVSHDFCGHGIGKNLHEDPQIPSYGDPYYHNIRVNAGDYLTIEPIVALGRGSLKCHTCPKDGWSMISDRRSAQFEHTIRITEDGYVLIT